MGGPKICLYSISYLLPYVPPKRDPTRSPSVAVGMSSPGSWSKINRKIRRPSMGDLLSPELLQPFLGTEVSCLFSASPVQGHLIVIIQLINHFDCFLSWVKGEKRET